MSGDLPIHALENLTVTDKPDNLLDRMKLLGERLTILGPKPQNLPYEEIVARIAVFMLSQEKLRTDYAFSNEVGEDLEDDDDARFDPIALYAAHPESFDAIAMFVDAEMSEHEEELLSCKDASLFAYNTRVFGAALRLARSEKISPILMGFLVEHLIKPNPPQKLKGRGRPKDTTDDLTFKRQAIEFAVAHGLTPTRNDASTDMTSACDAVADAGRKLYQQHGNPKFISGYTFEALKKVWQKNV